MHAHCQLCGSNQPVAEITNPAVGEYSACYSCMMTGMRPLCEHGCGHQAEFIAEGKRWCSECYDKDRQVKDAAALVRITERVQAAQAEIDARIASGIEAALKARGL